MSKTKIIVLLGSTRIGRMGERVAKYVCKQVEDHGMEAILFDPLTIPFEILRQPIQYLEKPEDAPAWMKEMNETIIGADGFLIVSTEYNCGIPPALSNMMDHFPPSSYSHRPCGIITYSHGYYGGARVGVVIRPFTGALSMIPMPSNLAIPNVEESFEEDGTCKTERMASRVKKIVSELGWYANALKSYKETHPPPK